MPRIGFVSIIPLISSVLLISTSSLSAYTLVPDRAWLDSQGPGRHPNAIPCSEIGDNGVITENTTLTSDLIGYSNRCLEIAADSVTLDCAGYSISGFGDGIYSLGHSDLVVRNCNIDIVGDAVDFRSVVGGEVYGNEFSNTFRFTIGVNNMVVSDNTFRSTMLVADCLSNVFQNNVFDVRGVQDAAVSLDGPSNSFVGNVFLGDPTEYGVLSFEGAQGNLFENNSFSGFYTGIGLFSIFERGNSDNVLRGNLFENNTIGVAIGSGDLNQISGNTLQNNGMGFRMADSYNNIIYDNDIYDAHNDWTGLDQNLFCLDGVPNRYHFDAPPCGDSLYADCIPDCSETLDDQSQFFKDDYGWEVVSDSGAVAGSMRIHPPGNGTERVLWHVHTVEGNFRVKLWQFTPVVPELYATDAHYYIVHRDGIAEQIIDWRNPASGWLDFGRFTFTDNPNQGVWLSDQADGYLIADAIKIISTDPFLVHEREPVAR